MRPLKIHNSMGQWMDKQSCCSKIKSFLILRLLQHQCWTAIASSGCVTLLSLINHIQYNSRVNCSMSVCIPPLGYQSLHGLQGRRRLIFISLEIEFHNHRLWTCVLWLLYSQAANVAAVICCCTFFFFLWGSGWVSFHHCFYISWPVTKEHNHWYNPLKLVWSSASMMVPIKPHNTLTLKLHRVNSVCSFIVFLSQHMHFQWLSLQLRKLLQSNPFAHSWNLHKDCLTS